MTRQAHRLADHYGWPAEHAERVYRAARRDGFGAAMAHLEAVPAARVRARSAGALRQAHRRRDWLALADRVMSVVGLVAALALEVYAPLRLLPLSVTVLFWLGQAALLVFVLAALPRTAGR